MDTLFQIVILIFSVIVHEISHGYAALALGDRTAKNAGRLTLNPLPHIDPIGSILLPGFLILMQSSFLIGWARPVPYNPYNLSNQRWGPALVGAAGPLSNLLMAFLFGMLIRAVLLFTEPTQFILNLAPIFSIIVFINVLLAVFNLVPIPPLDGSKVLFAFLPYRLRWIEEFLQAYGLVILLLFIFFFLQFLFPVILFIFSLLTGQKLF